MLLTVYGSQGSQFGHLLTPTPFPKTALSQQLEINGLTKCRAFSPLKQLCLIITKHVRSSSFWPCV